MEEVIPKRGDVFVEHRDEQYFVVYWAEDNRQFYVEIDNLESTKFNNKYEGDYPPKTFMDAVFYQATEEQIKGFFENIEDYYSEAKKMYNQRTTFKWF